MSTLYGFARSSGASRIGRVVISPELPVDYLAAPTVTRLARGRRDVDGVRLGNPTPSGVRKRANKVFSTSIAAAELNFSSPFIATLSMASTRLRRIAAV